MPNTVIVTVDSLRADHCSAYGYDRKTTPFLDSLDGRVFRRAYANAPYTPASVPSFLTGRLPLSDGHVVYRGEPTLPAYVDSTPYTTGAAFNNAQISRFGLDEEFDTVRALTGETDASDDRTPPGPFERLKRSLLSNKRISTHAREFYYRFNELEQPHPPDDAVVDAAIEFIKATTEPFVLWVHLMNPHHPHQFDRSDFERLGPRYDPNRFARLHVKAMADVTSGAYRSEPDRDGKAYFTTGYDASIRATDRQIERLAETLDFDRTRLLVTADHGEELWDRGYFGHAARPGKPRNAQLHEEMIRVPLIARGPDTTPGATTTPVSLLDIVPTVLRDAGLDTDHLRGTPLQPLLAGTDDPRPPVVAHATSPGDPNAFYEEEGGRWLGTVVEDRYKYVHYQTKDDELFDLREDPDERRDRREERPSTAERLRERVTATLDPRPDETDHADSGAVNESVERRLQELGYLN